MGPAFMVSSASSSSNHAMGVAFEMVRSGMADVMLTGGSEAMLSFAGIKAWEGLRGTSQDGCRPFSATRNGMVEGEGAAVFVFEDWDRASARGADILAEVAGFGMTADAKHIVMPSVDGTERATRAALAEAGWPLEQVGYVNARGTGTAANDHTECAALARVFISQAERLLVSSTKSTRGHVMGGQAPLNCWPA